MAGITKESNPICQGCRIWGACTGGYMGETPPCGRVAQNSASTNTRYATALEVAEEHKASDDYDPSFPNFMEWCRQRLNTKGTSHS